MAVRVRDRGARRLIQTTERMARAPLTAEVGILGDEASAPAAGSPSITVADIASIHEFGLGVPMRSFIRAWVDASLNDLSNISFTLNRRTLLLQITPEQAINQLGAFVVGGIQQFIANGEVEPPLDPRTIRRKGSSTPLIDTGQLRSSITYRIVDTRGT